MIEIQTDSLLAGLSPEQVKAVTTTSGPVICVACPGAGKTAVLTRRIVYLIQQGVSPKSIMAVTFTRKATQEMEERVIKLLGSRDAAQGLSIGTFHSIALRIVRGQYDKLGFTVTPKLAQLDDQRRILNRLRIYGEAQESFLMTVSKLKCMAMEPESPAERQRYKAYQDALTQDGMMDYDDQILLAVRIMETCSEVREAVQQRFQYIMVDEFQDTNPAQYQLLRLLASPKNNLFAVGDDAQSVYRFRAADIGIFLGFQRDYPTAKQIVLDRNYRSMPLICQAATRLISHNPNQVRKEIKAYRTDMGWIRAVACMDQDSEIETVVNNIVGLILQGIPLTEIAVLYRTHQQARPVAKALAERGIPYEVKDSEGIPSRQNGVQLMTMQGAKGLEFRAVCIIGVAEGLIPYRDASSEDDIAEERRIFYVGITRAKDFLLVTYSQGGEQEQKRSRFLAEMMETPYSLE